MAVETQCSMLTLAVAVARTIIVDMDLSALSSASEDLVAALIWQLLNTQKASSVSLVPNAMEILMVFSGALVPTSAASSPARSLKFVEHDLSHMAYGISIWVTLHEFGASDQPELPAMFIACLCLWYLRVYACACACVWRVYMQHKQIS